MIKTGTIDGACTRLIYQFASANDGARWEEAANLFTEDGVFARPSAPDQPLMGRDNILAGFRSRPPRLTRHVMTNIVVTAQEPDVASAESLILLYVADDAGRAKPPLVGEFHDRLVLTPAGWRFGERRGRLVFQP